MDTAFLEDRLIIFGRYPVPGNTKTRLIPALGPVGAARVQRYLTEKTLSKARTFAARYKITLECCFEGGSPRKIHRWLGPVPMLTSQRAGDLGQRMRSALFNALNDGCRRVILVGTDIPGLTVQILKEAFDVLQSHDVVLGPSTDGGYWLMGVKQPMDLFRNISWSTPRVLEETLAQIRRLNLTVHVLRPLGDVDTPEDLKGWPHEEKFPAIFLTVVIPTLNEENYIHRSLSTVLNRDVEVVVADGGSNDRTVTLAERSGVRVIHSLPGRARQQNYGASFASGENLLFLHGDTLLPEGYVTEAFEALMAQETVLGAFRFKTDFHRPLMRLVEWMTHLRSKYLRLPYGDQGIFMKKSVFERAGGFPVVPIGEDLLLVRRLVKHENARVVITQGAAVTSGRRWKTHGPLRTTWINQQMLAGMALGISAKTLSRLYQKPS